MIYLDLFLGFLWVGCFSFGGAYGAIPLIRDVVLSHGWLTDESLTYMIAVSESTPGPIMINLATYIGSVKGGILGAVAATFAVALPSFVITILLVALLKNALKNRYAQAVMNGITPCVIGIILSTGAIMVFENCFASLTNPGIDPRSIIITIVLAAVMLGFKKLKGKKLSPILLIVISAFLGVGVYSI